MVPKATPRAGLFRVAPLLALVVVALMISSWRTHRNVIVAEQRTSRMTGTLLDRRSADEEHETFTFAIDRGPLALVTLGQGPQPGTRAIIRGRVEPLDDVRNPGDTSERTIESERGIGARIEGARLIASLGPATDWRSRLAQLRSHAHVLLAQHLGEPGASIVAGELWGERAQLPPDLRREFQETGTVHVLVTAGLHVGLIAALVLWLLVRAGVPRAAACAIAILSVWAFALASGLALPALRAAVMASTALLARASGRAAMSWRTLLVAAAVVIAAIPGSAQTPSFWLSFSCVGAIFLLAEPLNARLSATPLPERVREAIVLTLATQLGTWPIVAAMFEQWSSYAVFANLAVVPCVPITMLLGAAQLALSWAAPLAQACANLNGWVLAWVTGVVRLLATLPASTVVMTPAPLALIVLYQVALAASALMLRRAAPVPAVALWALVTSLVLWPPHPLRGPLRIVVLDVGQADAIVIETPSHHAILVDAGGRLEHGPSGDQSVAERVGERIVVPFLIREGIHKLDALIISHPHGDHVGGCRPVLDKLRVVEVADSGQTYGGHAYHDCLDTARADGVPIVHPRAGMVWRTDDGVTLAFIGPQLPFIGGKNAINDNSIAFILQYRQFRMLFTGDAGVAAERRFLSEGVDLHADVLKIGHHGSAYSSSTQFIGAVHPNYGLISVGRHNLFGHPAPSTIATLEHAGIRVDRTDENAAVTVESDGVTSSVRSLLPNKP
jgi:competence protein ComEC